MVHRFDKADEWAKVFDDPARDAWQLPDDVVADLALSPGMSVADVGAGTGYFEGRLSRAVGPKGYVLAEDIEPDMVRYLRERAAREGWDNVRVVLGTADGSLHVANLDRILIVDVWHHIADRRAFALMLATALKSGGSVHIVEFKMDSKRGPPIAHRLKPSDVALDLSSAGFIVKVSPTTLPDQYIVIGVKR